MSHNHLQIAHLNCVCLSHRGLVSWGCLLWVKFSKIPKLKFESQVNVINRALFSVKARCSPNQSTGYMETLFQIAVQCDRHTYLPTIPTLGPFFVYTVYVRCLCG